tara:strand:+ start:963 stop:1997 length:1035 start_codon:yes stop_codon:yes gene_type:complete
MASITSTSVPVLDGAKNIREDLGNVIFNVTPFQTPFTSGIAQTAVTADTHEWLTDTLAVAVSDNAVVEAGIPQAAVAGTTRTRKGNFIQIADSSVVVTNKAEFMDRAGVPGREMAYQLMKKGKELQMDVEKQTLGAYGVTNPTVAGTIGATKRQGSSTLPGVSAAFGSWILTNQAGNGVAGASDNTASDGTTVPVVGTATAAISQTEMDDLLDGVWNSSGDFGALKLMASAGTVSSLRNGLSGMADNVDSNLNGNSSNGGNIISRVAVYVSQFGPVAVVPNKHMPANTLYAVDYSTWGLAFAGGKKIHTTDLATQTSAEQKLLECYYTLECRSEEANGAYYNIT